MVRSVRYGRCEWVPKLQYTDEYFAPKNSQAANIRDRDRGEERWSLAEALFTALPVKWQKAAGQGDPTNSSAAT